MAKVRGEFIRLGNGPSYGGGGWPNVLEGRGCATPMDLTVTGTATTVGAGPIVPSFSLDDNGASAPAAANSSRGHIRLIADANMFICVFRNGDADWVAGVATPTHPHSYYIRAGIQEVIPVKTGDRISAITGTL